MSYAFSFGKYKGTEISEVPEEYLRYLWESDMRLDPELYQALNASIGPLTPKYRVEEQRDKALDLANKLKQHHHQYRIEEPGWQPIRRASVADDQIEESENGFCEQPVGRVATSKNDAAPLFDNLDEPF